MSDLRIAVAVSGGRDSMALLHCLGRAARAASGVEVWALHVHHGLQPQAEAWAAFVAAACTRWRRRGMPLQFAMRRLGDRPQRGQSVEAWARAARYAALTTMAIEAGCRTVALAHHRGDQAETFLLQALRGAGPAGLASMPERAERGGIVWLRPWLAQPREAIEAYVRAHRIGYVDDASNADGRFARNRLRLEVMPGLRAAFPDAEAALAQAAAHAARARALIDEVGQADLATAVDGDALRLDPWRALTPLRRRECLRAWLQPRLPAGVGDALLSRLLDELPQRAPARWPVGEVELRRYRGRLTAHAGGAARAGMASSWSLAPDRVGSHAVPGMPARLRVRRVGAAAEGLPLALLGDARWQARQGGERFQRAAGTPPRSLKKQFQSAAVPAWSRDAPLLFSADGQLLFVPGLGIDARALARPGQPRVSLAWVSAG
jgi:tRNA(Ile)-lysidine synthase